MKQLLRLSYEFVFRGKWASKAITVILSCFCFSLFALATMAYTYRETDFMARGYLNYLQGQEYLVFENADQKDDNLIGAEDLGLIESKVDAEFITAYSCALDVSRSVYQYYFGGEKFSEETQSSALAAHVSDWRAHADFVPAEKDVLVKPAETYESWGFELLAGKYPEAVNEAALSAEYFDLFRWGGYSDSAWLNFNGDFGWNGSGYVTPNARVEINSYSDLLGKTLFDRDANELVVIVGIVDTHPEAFQTVKLDGHSARNFAQGARFRAPAWKERQSANKTLSAEYLYAPVTPEVLTLKTMRSVAEVSSRMAKRFMERHGQQEIPIGVGAHDFFRLINIRDVGDASFLNTETNSMAMVLSVGSVIFLIFSVLLDFYLMSALLERKQKQIGILRSLGGSEKLITAIFLVGTVMLAGVIFAASVLMTLVHYYGWLRPLTFIEQYGVSPFRFNGWTVLLLASVSFGVPLLAALLPIKRFFRLTVVENINHVAKRKPLKEVT